MNTKRLIELTIEYKELQERIEELAQRKINIESEIEMMIEGKTTGSYIPRGESAAQKALPPSRKRQKKRRRGSSRKDIKRPKTKAGEEIDAYEALLLEHFKKNPDTLLTCNELYNELGAKSDTDKSRTRAALTRLRKSRFIVSAGRGTYVLTRRGGPNNRATDDEQALMSAMDPGKPMRSREILARVNPPSYRYHALENRLWMMSQAGKLKRLERGIYMLVEH